MATSTIADAADALQPIMQCFKELQNNLVEQLNQDPVPQISSQQIKETTAWLESSMNAMNHAISLYSPKGLKTLNDGELSQAADRVREACRRLSLIHADKASKFGGAQAQGALVVSKKLRSNEIRTKLQQFSGFLKTFGDAEWLGNMVADEFLKQKVTALAVLEGLQNPAKISFCPRCSIIHQDPTSCPSYRSAYGATYCPHGAYGSSCAQCVAQNRQAATTNEYVSSVLYSKAPADDGTCKGKLTRMAGLTSALMLACQRSAECHGRRMQDLSCKMDTLKNFTETLSELPKVLRTFILLRIDVIKDYEALKSWVSQEEATAAQQTLERFRDEAIEEKAFRRLATRKRSNQL